MIIIECYWYEYCMEFCLILMFEEKLLMTLNDLMKFYMRLQLDFLETISDLFQCFCLSSVTCKLISNWFLQLLHLFDQWFSNTARALNYYIIVYFYKISVLFKFYFLASEFLLLYYFFVSGFLFFIYFFEIELLFYLFGSTSLQFLFDFLEITILSFYFISLKILVFMFILFLIFTLFFWKYYFLFYFLQGTFFYLYFISFKVLFFLFYFLKLLPFIYSYTNLQVRKEITCSLEIL